MTDVLGAIIAHVRNRSSRPDKRGVATSDLARPLVFVPGLTEGEMAFVRENRTQLGSGRARRAVDSMRAAWMLLWALPKVLQLLILVTVVVAVINLPYAMMYVIRALMASDRHASARMLASLSSSIVLVVVIVAVRVLL